MVKYISWIVKYYYYFVILWAMLNMLGLRNFENGMIKVATVVAVLSLYSIRFKKNDILVLIYIIYVMVISLLSDVNIDIFSDAIRAQLMPISFYFIARANSFDNDSFINNLRVPLLFAFVSALYLYFFPPAWYIDFKQQNWVYVVTDQDYYERMRLSGFWHWSYFIGYSSLFLLMYEIKRFIFEKDHSKYLILSVLISSLVLFLAQQRVSIAYFVLYIVIIIAYSYKIRLISMQQVLRIITLITILCLGIVSVLIIYGDDALITYVLNRSVNSDSNIVTDRLKLFDYFIGNISTLGDGLGQYSHYAISLGRRGIPDCDYIRIPNEIGVVGTVILFSIFILSFFKGLKNINSNFVELNLILFLFISMIGAAPLEMAYLQPFIYWFAAGKLVNNDNDGCINNISKL